MADLSSLTHYPRSALSVCCFRCRLESADCFTCFGVPGDPALVILTLPMLEPNDSTLLLEVRQ